MSPEATESRNASIGRIITPVDGSDNSKRAVQEAFRLAKQTHQDILALYVVDTPRLTSVIPPDQVSTFWAEGLSQQGEEVLKEVSDLGEKEGVKVEKKLVVGFPEEEILKAATKDDTIVMGCKGKTALDRLFLGSVCENVIHHSSTPVMVVH
jgi:nucleotide-binding universal stress UspA family protein